MNRESPAAALGAFFFRIADRLSRAPAGAAPGISEGGGNSHRRGRVGYRTYVSPSLCGRLLVATRTLGSRCWRWHVRWWWSRWCASVVALVGPAVKRAAFRRRANRAVQKNHHEKKKKSHGDANGRMIRYLAPFGTTVGG